MFLSAQFEILLPPLVETSGLAPGLRREWKSADRPSFFALASTTTQSGNLHPFLADPCHQV
jgi:hypothetical protein